MVEDVLGFGIATGNGVADDDEVGFVREVLFRVSGYDFDFPVRKERGHGGINVLIGAGYLYAHLLHGRRGRSHRGAADTHKMDRLNARKHWQLR